MPQYLVGSYQPDPVDPSTGTAQTLDGRNVTVSKAEFDRDATQQFEPLAGNPLASPAPQGQAPMGPPEAPSWDPVQPPNPAPSSPPPEPAPPQEPALGGFNPMGLPSGMWQGGAEPEPPPAPLNPGQIPEGMEATPLGQAEDPNAVPDAMRPNMSEVIQPAQGGAMAPFSASSGGSSSLGVTEGVTTSEKEAAETPEQRAARLSQSAGDLSDATRSRVFSESQASRDALESVQASLAEQEQRYRAALAEAEASKAVHERYSQALVETPIDPSEYQSVGERISSAAALILSGFIQGLSGGRNPALDQMMRMYEHRRDSWVAEQLRTRDTKLAMRRDMMRSDEAAASSARAQIDATLKAKIENEARLAGLPDPGPVAAEAMAKIDFDAQQHQQKILGEAQKQISSTTQKVLQEQQQTESTQRQTKGEPEVRRMDAALSAVGSDRKRWQEAMDPQGANLSGKAESAKMLEEYTRLLEEMARANGGKLPNQEVVSFDNFQWLRRKLAQSGLVDSKAALTADALQEAVGLYIKSSMNSKTIDGQLEAEALKKSYNTGETSTTLQRLRAISGKARTDLEASATGFADDPKGFLQLLDRQVDVSHGPRQDEVEQIRSNFIPLERGEAPGPNDAVDQGPLGATPAPDQEGDTMADVPTRALKSGEQVPVNLTPVNPDEIRGMLAAKLGGDEVADVLMRQANLESGKGKSAYGFNFFGRKAREGEKHQLLKTWEVVGGEKKRVREPFASFDSLEEAVDDYIDLLSKNYPKALEAARRGDVDGFNRELKAGGYYTADEDEYRKGLGG